VNVEAVADDGEFVELVARAQIARAFERELLSEAVTEALANVIAALAKGKRK
jgi:hypothetical protein